MFDLWPLFVNTLLQYLGMKNKTALAFDFDGTLADSTSLELKTMCDTIRLFGTLKLDKDSDLEKYYGPTEEGIIKEFVPPDRFEEAWAFFLNEYRTLSKELLGKPFDGMDELLSKYHQKNNILKVLITGRSRPTLDISLTDIGLAAYFDKCYTGSEKGVNKDQSIESLLHDYGLEKEDVIYIGDTETDIKTMRKAGIDIISAVYAYPKEYQERIDRLNPSKVAHSVKELETLLDLATKKD